MLMAPPDYANLTGGDVYVAPVRPPIPVYAGTAAQVAALRDAYQETMTTYMESRDLANQVKRAILQAVPHTYLCELSDPDLGFSNVSPQQMLDHLIQNYGQITHNDLRENLELLKKPWDPDTPIEQVFEHGTFCRKFATEGQDPISDTAYLVNLVQIFENSGVLDKAVEDWERKPTAQQTLTNAIQHFKNANKHRLVKESKQTKSVLAANTATQAPTINKPTGLEGYSYCWSHGICKHGGLECTNPRESHCPDATWSHRKGGSTNVQGARKPKVPNRRASETTTQPST
jgi:hypothetical protein